VIAQRDTAHEAIERWAANIANEREQLADQNEATVKASVDLLDEAEEVGFTLEEVAALLGVTTQTLRRWRRSEQRRR
jgi:predicted transcriptional regulator